MPRPLLVEHAVELPVAPGEVRRTLLELDGTDRGDGLYTFPIEHDPAADGWLGARISVNEDGTTHVELAAGNGIRLPFFHSLVSSVIGLHYQQAIDQLAARLEHRLAGGSEDGAKPIRRNPLLPSVPYTQAQAVGLSTAGFAVAIATFGQAIVQQYSKPIQETFFGLHHTDFKLTWILAIIRLGALDLAVRRSAERPPRPPPAHPPVADRLVGRESAHRSGARPRVVHDAPAPRRGCALTTVFVGGVIALEEAPEGARGFATSMLALAGGFGFTLAVILLPLGKHGHWRYIFVFSALFGILTLRVAKFLKESPRFENIEQTTIRRGRIGEVLNRRYRGRFMLLAAIAFLTNILTAPSSSLTNNYLSTNRHFSDVKILLWRSATTSWTGLIGLALAGVLVERYGRRSTAFVTLTVGGLVRLVFYLTGGVTLWMASGIGDMVFAAGFLAIATLNVELFPTEARGHRGGAGQRRRRVRLDSGHARSRLHQRSLRRPRSCVGDLHRADARCRDHRRAVPH